MSGFVSRRLVVMGVSLVLASAIALEAGMKVKSQQDKAFDFRGLRTWAWHPGGAGDVKMGVSPDDKPEAVRARFEPVIMDAVQQEFGKRQLTMATGAEAPQLYVMYFVLISTNMSAQTLGQFVPTVPEWGLPPFSGATQSLRVFEQGSLVLDVSSASTKSMIWRGVVQAEIDRDRKPAERDARLRAAIADLVKKFPKTS